MILADMSEYNICLFQKKEPAVMEAVEPETGERQTDAASKGQAAIKPESVRNPM